MLLQHGGLLLCTHYTPPGGRLQLTIILNCGCGLLIPYEALIFFAVFSSHIVLHDRNENWTPQRGIWSPPIAADTAAPPSGILAPALAAIHELAGAPRRGFRATAADGGQVGIPKMGNCMMKMPCWQMLIT